METFTNPGDSSGLLTVVSVTPLEDAHGALLLALAEALDSQTAQSAALEERVEKLESALAVYT